MRRSGVEAHPASDRSRHERDRPLPDAGRSQTGSQGRRGHRVVTFVEIVWVLESDFELDREQIALAIGGFLEARELIVDRAPSVAQAVRAYRRGKADFADALIERISSDAGCEATLTFDARAARDAGMRLIM